VIAENIKIYSINVSSYHIVDLKRQKCLEVGTNKPKLKVKMQSVISIRWWCLEKTSWTDNVPCLCVLFRWCLCI